jgi:hypothetical protein
MESLKSIFGHSLLLGLLAVFSLSCGNRNSGDGYYSAVNSQEMEVSARANDGETIPQRIIKEGYLSIEVREINQATGAIAAKIKELDGFVASESAYSESSRSSRNMTVRIPADRFDQLITFLEAQAVRVANKNITLRDVSEEFVDVHARLTTKRELEQRYRELLAKAKTVDEMLSIERELTNVRAEIESMTGRLKYLSDRVALSTLNLEVFQTYSPAYAFGQKLSKSFVDGWYAFLGFLVWLAGLWPFVLILVVAVFFYIRRRRKNRQQQ